MQLFIWPIRKLVQISLAKYEGGLRCKVWHCTITGLKYFISIRLELGVRNVRQRDIL